MPSFLALLLLLPAVGRAIDAAPEPARRVTLEQAISIALASNRGLAGAADQVEGVQYAREAAGAEFELKITPQARVGAAGADGESEGQYGFGIAVGKRTAVGTAVSLEAGLARADELWGADLDLKLQQPLLRGRGAEVNLASVREAEYSGRSARRALYQRQVETVLETVTAVYGVVQQRELRRLYEESADRLRGHADAARAKEKIGLAGPIDVYRAAIQLQSAEDALATTRESLQDAGDSLKIVLALPLEGPIDVEAPLAYDRVALAEEEAVGAALTRRVELDQAADTVRETERQARLAKHAILPELNLSLNYRRFDDAVRLADSALLGRSAWGVGLETSTTIGRTVERAAYRQSLLGVRASARAAELQRDQIVRETRREFRSLRRSEQRIAIQGEQIRQAEGQLELAKVKFRHGLANNFDVIEAESTLRRARADLLGAVTDYIVGVYRLRAALGTLLQRPESF